MNQTRIPLARRAVGAAGAVAAVCSLLMSSPVASAAPQPQNAEEPTIYPTPQSMEQRGGKAVLKGKVSLVVGESTDQPAVEAATNLLDNVSARVDVIGPGKKIRGGSVVYLGTTANNSDVGPALNRLDIDRREALDNDEGYILAAGTVSGQSTVVLAGADATGTFYAVQSLRQVIGEGHMPAMVVQDWPLMSIRGVIEGFYGTPWTHQARLDQFEFYGEQKMNTYIYSPKDDPLLRAKWREPYTGKQKQQLQELINTAKANHVDFTFALSPGNDICYSSQDDLQATVAKFESLYELGVRSFYIALDDIAPYLVCPADKEMFTKTNFRDLADAQAYYLNAVNQAFIKKHPDVGPLQMVPTNYAGSAEDPYKDELGIMMDDDIVIQWTGEQVVSHRITTEDTQRARITYGDEGQPRGLFIWDNYPVNDFAHDQLFMSPLIGRDSDLHKATLGITSNPMNQSYASLPVLFTYADFMWNGPAYQPESSMAAALRYVAGDDRRLLKSLTAFADLNQNWQDDVLTPSAPALSADVDAFWATYDDGGFPEDSALAARAELIQNMPKVLDDLAVQGFYADTRHWINAAAHWGDATEAALDMLEAIDRGEHSGVMAARAHLEDAVEAAEQATQPTLDQGLITPKVGDGVFQQFVTKAKAAADKWLEEGERAGRVEPAAVSVPS